MTRRRALARAVRQDLAAAGLPVTTGDEWFVDALHTGAHVTIDGLDDESGGGVIVYWVVHHVLRTASQKATFSGDRNNAALRHAGAACSAMQDAIAEILTAAGYAVVKDYNDLAPFQMKVLGRTPPGPSWQDFLDEQSEALTKLMHATYRRQHGGD
jgi:hypothetical protein